MSEENAGASGTSAAGDPENPRHLRFQAASPRPYRSFLAWLALAVAALSLFLPLSAGGIWDPPEREVAELGRRIALNLLGGQALSVDGANNEVPTRSELGRGELPFTSIAVGFRVFGLHDWAGRLPLALWAVLGLAATYLLVERLADRRSAWFSVLVLSTMPLYYVQARTMLGDVVTMASLALSVSGLALGVFERGPGRGPGGRALAFALGCLGALCAVLSRGVLIGLAVPALSVGLTWLCLRGAGLARRERLGDALGLLSLLGGAAAFVAAWLALLHAPESAGPFSLLLGSAVSRPHVLPTFDHVLLQLGHALFPWSAVLPVALGALLRAPKVVDPLAGEREAALRLLSLLVPTVALLAYGLAAPVIGPTPFAAVSMLAIAVALFARDFERGSDASRAASMVVCAFAVLLLVDFKNFPDKALSAFSVSDVHFPDSFRTLAEQLLEAGTLLFSAAFFFLLQERSSHDDVRFSGREYLAWPRRLHELWAGNLQFALVVVEAALIGLCALGFLGEHLPAFSRLGAVAAGPRRVALYGAVAVPLLLAAPLLLTLVRDAFRTLFDPELATVFGQRPIVARALSLGLSRGAFALFAGAGFGLCLSLGFYPRLLAEITPKQVFDAYRRKAHSGEPLGILGPGAASATYYAGQNVPAFDTPARALDWLTLLPTRRWLVIRENELPTLNASYRARGNPPRNLPVLSNGSSEHLLVSNLLGDGPNDNPLARFLPDEAPKPSRELSANLGDQLDVLGWDVLDLEGRSVAAVEPGRHYTFVIDYRVVQPISGSWETFIHVDGFQRRYNGDHPTLGGRYPFNLWRVGDFISDRSDFSLEPNFGAGRYRVYFGLYNGNRRLEVRRGQAEENRLDAGFLDVR